MIDEPMQRRNRLDDIGLFRRDLGIYFIDTKNFVVDRDIEIKGNRIWNK